MGKITGFLEFERLEEDHETVEARKKHYREFYLRLSDEAAAVQAYLQDRETDKAAALAEMAWAMIASVEFRFNH